MAAWQNFSGAYLIAAPLVIAPCGSTYSNRSTSASPVPRDELMAVALALGLLMGVVLCVALLLARIAKIV